MRPLVFLGGLCGAPAAFTLTGWSLQVALGLFSFGSALWAQKAPIVVPALPQTLSKKSHQASEIKGPIPAVRWLTTSTDGAIRSLGGVLPETRQPMPRLRLQLTKLLSAKQVSMIEGGFTTVSQLTIHFSNTANEGKVARDEDEDENDEREATSIKNVPLKRVTCSVKFDAWQETFELIRLLEDSNPEKSSSKALPVTVKNLDEYGDVCLSTDIDLDNKTGSLALYGGVLLATMAVKQTSLDETAKIKEWLIQQQSGVIQGLFSHMLGDLSINQIVRTNLMVPPYSFQKMGDYKR